MGRPSSSVEVDGILYKKCPACLTTKPHNDYAKCAGRAHGIQSVCKPCGSAKSKRWNDANQERHRANVRRWEKENPERVESTSKAYHSANKVEKLLKAHEWYARNRDRAIANRSAYRVANIESERQKMRDYCAKNAEVFLAKNSRRRAAQSASVAAFDADLLSLVEIESFSLARMRSDVTGFPWQVDHVIPIVSPKRHSLNGNKLPPRGFCGPLFPVVHAFHNEYNLAVIPAKTNAMKSNRYWPGMP